MMTMNILTSISVMDIYTSDCKIEEYDHILNDIGLKAPISQHNIIE